VTRVPNIRKWLIRSFMLLLILAAYGGTAVGNRNLIKVAEATESEGESFVCHELTATRREPSSPKRRRERRNTELAEHRPRPDFRRHGQLWFVSERFAPRQAFSPPRPPRAPPVFSE
jgi:hypothetical protein